MIIGHEFLILEVLDFTNYTRISLNLHDLLSLNLDTNVVPSVTNTNFRGFCCYVYPQNSLKCNFY